MVEFYFKDKKLGTLDYDGINYIYNSCIESESYANETYFLDITDYDLFDSKAKTSQKLFKFFEKIVNQVKKSKDLLKMLQITNNDTDFDIRTKLGKTKQNNEKFYLKNV